MVVMVAKEEEEDETLLFAPSLLWCADKTTMQVRHNA